MSNPEPKTNYTIADGKLKMENATYLLSDIKSVQMKEERPFTLVSVGIAIASFLFVIWISVGRGWFYQVLDFGFYGLGLWVFTYTVYYDVIIGMSAGLITVRRFTYVGMGESEVEKASATELANDIGKQIQ